MTTYYGGIITGSLRKLLSSSINSMAEIADPNEPLQTSISTFNKLTTTQQLTGLLLIGKALFTDEINIPIPNPLHDAIIAAILENVREQIESEIQEDSDAYDEDYHYWRKSLIKTCREFRASHYTPDEMKDTEALPSHKSTDMKEWNKALDEIIETQFEETDDYLYTPFREVKPLIKTLLCTTPTLSIGNWQTPPKDSLTIPSMDPFNAVEKTNRDNYIFDALINALKKMDMTYNPSQYRNPTPKKAGKKSPTKTDYR